MTVPDYIAKLKELRLRREELALRKKELQLKQWEAKYETKSELEGQGFKGLLLINGGAAIALAALFQAVISKAEAVEFVPWVLAGVVANILGVASAAIIFWVRYMQVKYEADHGKFFWENPWWPWRWYLGGFSVLCFLVAMGLVAYGGFTKLKLESSPAIHVRTLTGDTETLQHCGFRSAKCNARLAMNI